MNGTEKISIGLRTEMYVYAAESTGDYTVSKLKVCIPEMFVDKNIERAKEIKISSEDRNIYINKTNKPSLARVISSYNYITLPFATSSGRYINIGERFIANFISSPDDGIIIARM